LRTGGTVIGAIGALANVGVTPGRGALSADFARIARGLEGYASRPGEPKGAGEDSGADFEYDEKHKTVSPTERGIEKAEKFIGVEDKGQAPAAAAAMPVAEATEQVAAPAVS